MSTSNSPIPDSEIAIHDGACWCADSEATLVDDDDGVIGWAGRPLARTAIGP